MNPATTRLILQLSTSYCRSCRNLEFSFWLLKIKKWYSLPTQRILETGPWPKFPSYCFLKHILDQHPRPKFCSFCFETIGHLSLLRRLFWRTGLDSFPELLSLHFFAASSLLRHHSIHCIFCCVIAVSPSIAIAELTTDHRHRCLEYVEVHSPWFGNVHCQHHPHWLHRVWGYIVIFCC